MRKHLIRTAAAAGLFAFLLAGCSGTGSEHSMEGMNHSEKHTDSAPMPTTGSDTSGLTKTVAMSAIRQTEFTLTAQASNLEIESGKIIPVWTFNNSVPGPEIRVRQGDQVKITLKNTLPEPVSIHWHGLPVPISMDGIPGVTQNAVQPGQSFTYQFKASVPGTYWYHSHQDSVNQIDRGLYGSFIVESAADPIDRDYVVMLDEWISGTPSPAASAGVHESHSGHGMSSGSAAHDMSMYDLLTINGRSGTSVQSLAVKQGDHVRLRIINAGYKSHALHLHGHEWKITATDGQSVNQPGLLKDSFLSIAPGERYDVEFEANRPGDWFLEAHGSEPGVKGMKIKIAYEGTRGGTDTPNDMETGLPTLNIAAYGQSGPAPFKLNGPYDLTYTMNLGTENRDGATMYTINGRAYPNTETIRVKKGDKVQVKLVNLSKSDDHPMHLHGHFFQVLSHNGTPLSGSPIVKDTLNLKPGEEYVVAFEAGNSGDWMFHCHDLHHASAGMVTHLLYSDYKSDFVADPKSGNKPE
ncbi:multicopper oxidase family protein [Gorillibacterium sp. sgz5001074]|uniref:multicopper oxidase family protein n=1 Tax=Gorillibacterium sp. sgz5001074 TaxID=3446695 RepID=UPI003F67821A